MIQMINSLQVHAHVSFQANGQTMLSKTILSHIQKTWPTWRAASLLACSSAACSTQQHRWVSSVSFNVVYWLIASLLQIHLVVQASARSLFKETWYNQLVRTNATQICSNTDQYVRPLYFVDLPAFQLKKALGNLSQLHRKKYLWKLKI